MVKSGIECVVAHAHVQNVHVINKSQDFHKIRNFCPLAVSVQEASI